MSIEMNHTIVRTHDKQVSATFLAQVLGIPVGPPAGPFLPIQLDNGVTLDYLEVDDEPIRSQHYAFLVSDDVFDAAVSRIVEAGIGHWADPFRRERGRINPDWYGGRGVYFADPDDHYMELLTSTSTAEEDRGR